jgi:hypothetical protein
MEIKITRGSRKYLKKKLKKCGIRYDKDKAKEELLKLLGPYKEKLPENFKLIVDKEDALNGHNNFITGNISISSKHLLEYLSGEDKEFSGKCILECLGHELGHYKALAPLPFYVISKNICKKLATPDELFRSRLVEVYCDHNALNFTGFDTETHRMIMKEHLKSRKETKADKTDFFHPTWRERIKYIGMDFGENLIRQVAKDNKCRNEKMIADQIEYYRTVKRNNGYIRKKDKILFISSFLFSMITILLIIAYLYLPNLIEFV